VLEAAHIEPFGGAATNDLSKGLLLRADLHTLFDCHLIAINPRHRTVYISRKLRAHGDYMSFKGLRLRSPVKSADRPSAARLAARWAMKAK
jgi:hypothetical protein